MVYTSIPIKISWKSINEGRKNTAEYTVNFIRPIELDSTDYEIALTSLETYYSFPNIEEGVNNVFAYKKTPDSDSIIIKLPTGNYSISNIANEIRNQIGDIEYQDNIVLSQNDATLKAVFKLSPNYRIDFTVPNSIRTVLGFDSRIVGGLPNQKYYEGDNIVNILDVNTIMVNCDLVNDSYNNRELSPILYSFFPNVPPGYKIVINVSNPIYLRINKRTINSITLSLTDENNNLLNFRNEEITIGLHLRNIKY